MPLKSFEPPYVWQYIFAAQAYATQSPKSDGGAIYQAAVHTYLVLVVELSSACDTGEQELEVVL